MSSTYACSSSVWPCGRRLYTVACAPTPPVVRGVGCGPWEGDPTCSSPQPLTPVSTFNPHTAPTGIAVTDRRRQRFDQTLKQWPVRCPHLRAGRTMQERTWRSTTPLHLRLDHPQYRDHRCQRARCVSRIPCGLPYAEHRTPLRQGRSRSNLPSTWGLTSLRRSRVRTSVTTTGGERTGLGSG